MGLSFPNILFAVDSDRTTLYGALRRLFGSPFKTGIEKKSKKEESASIILSSVKALFIYSTTEGPSLVILQKASISGNSFTIVGPIMAGDVA